MVWCIWTLLNWLGIGAVVTLSTSSMSACISAKDALASSAAMAAAQGATLLHELDGYSVDVNRHRPYTY